MAVAKLILISGISRSGKSSLASQLSTQLKHCTIFSQDEHTLPENMLPKIKNRIDWEKPETVDWSKLNRRIDQPANSSEYIICEGIFAFCSHALLAKAHFTIAIDIPKASFFKRRRKEDRWGFEPEWFIQHVWNSHLRYHNPYVIKPDLTLNGTKPFNTEKVSELIRTKPPNH